MPWPSLTAVILQRNVLEDLKCSGFSLLPLVGLSWDHFPKVSSEKYRNDYFKALCTDPCLYEVRKRAWPCGQWQYRHILFFKYSYLWNQGKIIILISWAHPCKTYSLSHWQAIEILYCSWWALIQHFETPRQAKVDQLLITFLEFHSLYRQYLSGAEICGICVIVWTQTIRMTVVCTLNLWQIGISQNHVGKCQ